MTDTRPVDEELENPRSEPVAPEAPVDEPVVDEPVVVKDDRDVSPRAGKPKLTGKRVRAIPYKGGTQVLIRASDFEYLGIKHPAVLWDFRKNKRTVEVGREISAEAAKLLCDKYPTRFEFMGK